MATSEDRIDRLEEKYSNLHTAVNVMAAKVDAVSEKVDMLVGELRDFKNETRMQNVLRTKEIAELDKKQEKLKAQHDADIKEINAKIDSKFERLLSQMQNMAIAVVVGVGAVVVGVVSFVMSVVAK